MLVRSLLAALFVVACQPPAPSPSVSGTRLAPVEWDLKNGAAWGASAFYDKSLGIYCAFERVTTDEYRCVPVGRLAFTGVEYADASCTQRRAYAYKRCGMAPAVTHVVLYYGLEKDGSGCERRRYFSPGPSAPPASHSKLDGPCEPKSPSGSAEREWFELGEEIPLDRFVKAHAELTSFGTRYEALKIVAEDGSSVVQLGTLYDKQEDVLCALSPGSTYGLASDFICAPETFFAFSYQDPACQTPIVEVPPAQAAECAPAVALTQKSPRTLISANVAGCDRTTAIYTSVAASPEPRFQRNAGACVDDTSNAVAGHAYLRADMSLDLSRAGVVTLEKSGSGRLQAVSRRYEGGETVPAMGLRFDKELNVYCSPLLIGDKARCVPPSTAGMITFKDAACAQPVVRAQFDPLVAPSCPGLVPSGYAVLSDNACAANNRYFRVVEGGAAQPVSQVYERTSNGACQPDGTPGTVYDAVEVKPEAFAEIEDVSPK